MTTKIKIKTAKDGNFDGEKGVVKYQWYKGEVTADGGIEPKGTTLEFGSVDKSHVEGHEYDLDLAKEAKFDKKTGLQIGFKYKEYVEN